MKKFLIFKNLWVKKTTLHILREMRCDIEGCHDIAKLSEVEIEQAFDYRIEDIHKKPVYEITEDEILKDDIKSMKDGYLSYMTRKRLTLKYKKVNRKMVEEVLNIFFEHFSVKNREELTKELIEKFSGMEQKEGFEC